MMMVSALSVTEKREKRRKRGGNSFLVISYVPVIHAIVKKIPAPEKRREGVNEKEQVTKKTQ